MIFRGSGRSKSVSVRNTEIHKTEIQILPFNKYREVDILDKCQESSAQGKPSVVLQQPRETSYWALMTKSSLLLGSNDIEKLSKGLNKQEIPSKGLQ